MIPPLPQDQNEALARTPAAELAQLPFLQPEFITNSGIAHAVAKRANVRRVQAESVTWGDRGARLNSLSPGTGGDSSDGRKADKRSKARSSQQVT